MEADRSAFTIGEFCARNGFSRATYYNLRNAGQGPREMHIGVGVRISHEAAEEWRRKAEARPPKPGTAPTKVEAEAEAESQAKTADEAEAARDYEIASEFERTANR